MTIPVLVLIASVIIWAILAHSPKLSSPWLLRVCEIVFAAATLVTLWSVMNKVAF
jgi:hypothetical protein